MQTMLSQVGVVHHQKIGGINRRVLVEVDPIVHDRDLLAPLASKRHSLAGEVSDLVDNNLQTIGRPWSMPKKAASKALPLVPITLR